ncbi:baseplate J/gp47 family protein [Micromonospora sp. CB01531]|uniref:baseplate J/gp47 family protein n=1 Tax=Micromonospora sp. CB01531 TaxID=1718947 RepID=UPI0009389CCC|nr:baseplate J/gp47 family protein [Micromonospora sp. CB01531]OKI51398.1 hypothetical protein A6A27_33530 [Micromonospora sp. CB01531]
MRARTHGELLNDMLQHARDEFRDAQPAWDPARPGVENLPDHGRALLDSYAAALHVLWTYQGAWTDEGFLADPQLPASAQRLLELVGLQPDPGAAATGLQAVRCVTGRDGTIPPGFAVRAPAADGRLAQTYETLRARRVSWRLNELRPYLPPGADDGAIPAAPGAVSAVVPPASGQSSDGPSPFPRPSTAAGIIGRLQAARAGTLAQRQAAQARQTALRLAELARVVAPTADGASCNDTFSQLCRQLGAEAAAAAGPAAPEPGPLSESQETLIAALARIAVAQPTGLAALDDALRRCADEDDASWSRRLDKLASFLDLLVAGLQQHARDQVVLLHGPAALQRIDELDPAGTGARSGIAEPGTDALYLLPDRLGGHDGLLTPGDWLVVGEDDPDASRDGVAGVARIYHEAVQVVRVHQEVPAGQDRPMTRMTFRPPLRRRYRLAGAVLLGNILEISHGRTVRESGQRDGRFLVPAQSPLTWLRDPGPQAAEGRTAQLTLRSGGREWSRVPDLAGRSGVEPAFTVETQPGLRVRVRTGDDHEGASLPPGAAYELEYRVGVGIEGDQEPGAIRDLASAHPAVLDTSNPLPVTGGADPEPMERTRARARAGLHALQRAVSADDVASLATTYGGVRQASVAEGVPGRRRVLQVVVSGDRGEALDDTELVQLAAFLTARMPPSAGVRVRSRSLLPVRAAIRLLVPDGDDPLGVLAAASVRLGAARADGAPPGLLDPEAAVLGRDLNLSDLYRALDGLPGLASAEVTLLHRADEPAARRERITANPADLLVWAPAEAGAEALRLSWATAVDR